MKSSKTDNNSPACITIYAAQYPKVTVMACFVNDGHLTEEEEDPTPATGHSKEKEKKKEKENQKHSKTLAPRTQHTTAST